MQKLKGYYKNSFLNRQICKHANKYICTTIFQEMFVVEYFCEFQKLYTTRENKNCEDVGVVASKCYMDS